MQHTLRASQIILMNRPSFFCGSDKLQQRAYLPQHLPDEEIESLTVRARLLLPINIGVDLRCLRCGKFKPIDMFILVMVFQA